MAIIKPFKPLRPLSRFAGAVVAPPYDAVTIEEAQRIIWKNPLSFLKVLKPEVNVPFYSNSKEVVYNEAKNALKEFINNGIFTKEKKPHLYIYTEEINGKRQSGVVGLFSCEDYERGIVRRTENTRLDELDDRVQWIEHTGVQAGPIFLIYKENAALRKVIQKIMSTSPEYDFITEDSVRHIVHPVSDRQLTEKIQRIFLNIPTLYIADGNHRALAACKVNKKIASSEGFFIGAAVSSKEANIMAYNRMVKELSGLSKETFLRKLKNYFYVEKIYENIKPCCKHHFTMYLDGEWFKLIIKENYINKTTVLESLDTYFLEQYVFKSILGLDSKKSNGKIEFISEKENIKEIVNQVDRGESRVLFLLFPVDVEEMIRIVDQGFVMPPKSTWFEPKFRSGLFLNPLRDVMAEFKKNEKVFSEDDYNIWL